MPTLRPHLAFLYEILRKSGAYFKLRCGQNEIKIRSARGSYMKELICLILFHASLWANRGRNEVCPWQL